MKKVNRIMLFVFVFFVSMSLVVQPALASFDIYLDVPKEHTGDSNPYISVGGDESEVHFVYTSSSNTLELRDVNIQWKTTAWFYPGTLDWIKIQITYTRGEESKIVSYTLWDGWTSYSWDKGGTFSRFVGLSLTGSGSISVSITIQLRTRVFSMWKYPSVSVTI